MDESFRIHGPAVVSFSGGRTSSMMLRLILDANGGKLPSDVHVLFANTGKEMPETLDFVNECARRWNVPIIWLEYADNDEPKNRFRIVNHKTASRNGEPFATMIGRRKILPNPVMRLCTAELKIRPMKLYAQQVLGFAEWDVAIGFRADEPRRVARLSAPHNEPFNRIAPLALAGITASDVSAFWKAQPFDLELPDNNGVTMHGNCDLCYLKGANQIYSLIRESPERASWWMEQENRIVTQKTERYGLFRKDRPSYAQMHYNAINQMDMFHDAVDEPIMDCACAD